MCDMSVCGWVGGWGGILSETKVVEQLFHESTRVFQVHSLWGGSQREREHRKHTGGGAICSIQARLVHALHVPAPSGTFSGPWKTWTGHAADRPNAPGPATAGGGWFVCGWGHFRRWVVVRTPPPPCERPKRSECPKSSDRCAQSRATLRRRSLRRTGKGKMHSHGRKCFLFGSGNRVVGVRRCPPRSWTTHTTHVHIHTTIDEPGSMSLAGWT